MDPEIVLTVGTAVLVGNMATIVLTILTKIAFRRAINWYVNRTYKVPEPWGSDPSNN